MGAGGLDERSKGPSFGMAVAPKVDSSTITVVMDKLTGMDADRGQVVVVGSGKDNRGASSEEGDVEGS